MLWVAPLKHTMQGMDDAAWERAVEQACHGQAAFQVESLTLDGVVKCAQGKLPKSKVLASLSQLKRLSIANVGLSSLADFPSLAHLEQLVLSDNRIASGLEHLVGAGLKSLRELDLSNNKIQAVEDLKPLAELKLESLDLYECPVTRSAGYRAKVFGMMKSLRFLDKSDANGNERPESDEEEESESEEEDVDDMNGDGDGDGVEGEEEEDEEEEGVEGESKGAAVHEEDDDEGEEDEEGEDNEELEDEEEDEGGSYQEEMAMASNRGAAGPGQVGNEHGSEEEDEEDDNVEVQDIEEESEEEVGEEEDEDEDEEEEYGTKYLVQPIAQAEEDEGASDFEPGEDEEVEDEDFEDEEDDVVETAQELEVAKQKRAREEGGESEQRAAKR
nr:acidic leucine-rich nuclear phosphoprotein 32-related protein-like [Physcomitrium patens]XP_024368848.1 acidic leucine-rich nuclear phosphoprotein 32-related protein-like [Physcomitrium patens]XP_024368849.1 acidic leucine-rich nuclear phosphoprotein 32-related protein-like [Physcomitrium patens]XP_024368850.1 acidic leucine-rich nuclear phosphoprotein 32-related protein-like [Physcomitrium patens]|eukprot:XP_024368847.1 acidic leucine-rich nuclear phosphoprotein 32-related protein-like [Physcomitrella patens]